MNQELYERFKQLNSRGVRSEALDALNQFIQSFESFEEKRNFAFWFFRKDFDGTKISHELYRSILLPVLIDGYKKSDPWSMKQLGLTEENLLLADAESKEQLGYKTNRDFLRQYLTLCPTDSFARQKLVDDFIKMFRDCDHEWPAGILNGNTGATDVDCAELLEEASLVRGFDVERKYTNYISDFEMKVKTYRERIKKPLP